MLSVERSIGRKGSEMKRVFELSWADELGKMFLNRKSLEKLLRTEGFIDNRIQFKIEDITDKKPEAAEEEVPEPEEKPKTEKPVKPADPAEQVAEKRAPCRFKIGSKCHRFPATVILTPGQKQYLNPGVTDNCWCGEYKSIADGATGSTGETGSASN